MYEAGRESVRRGRVLWPMLAAAGFLLATALGTLLAVRPPVERVVNVQVEKPPEEPRQVPVVVPDAPGPREALASYWQLHMFVLEHGVDALPPPPPVPLPPRRNADDL